MVVVDAEDNMNGIRPFRFQMVLSVACFVVETNKPTLRACDGRIFCMASTSESLQRLQLDGLNRGLQQL